MKVDWLVFLLMLVIASFGIGLIRVADNVAKLERRVIYLESTLDIKEGDEG